MTVSVVRPMRTTTSGRTPRSFPSTVFTQYCASRLLRTLELSLVIAPFFCVGCGAKQDVSPYEAYEATLPKTEIDLPKIRASSQQFVPLSSVSFASAKAAIGTRLKVTFAGDSTSDVPGVILISWYDADDRSAGKGVAVNQASCLVTKDGNTGTAAFFFTKTPAPGKYQVEILEAVSEKRRKARIELSVLP